MADEKPTPYQKWYAVNKERLSVRRKQLYNSNPELREKIKERQKRYRESNPSRSKAGQTKVRMIDGKDHVVHRIGEAAVLISRDEQTIRNWEAKGLIPRPSVPGVHRYYTATQISLMCELREVIDDLRYNKGAFPSALKEQSEKLLTHWKD